MKNDFCDLDHDKLFSMFIPPLAVGLLTSPFQFNERNGWIMVPTETFKQFTDVVTAYVVAANEGRENK